MKLITWWLALIKNSEKHQESEKSKKVQIQILSSNVSELFINKKELTKQDELNNLKKIFTKKMRIDMKLFFKKLRNSEYKKMTI